MAEEEVNVKTADNNGTTLSDIGVSSGFDGLPKEEITQINQASSEAIMSPADLPSVGVSLSDLGITLEELSVIDGDEGVVKTVLEQIKGDAPEAVTEEVLNQDDEPTAVITPQQ